MRILASCLIVLLACAAGAAGCSKGDDRSGGARHGEVRVAAAADLKFALDAVIAEFRKGRGDIEVEVSYGSSGKFFTQLSAGAPFDMFLSADMDYPRKLVEQGLAAKETEFLYAVGRIVVWAPRQSALDVEGLGISALADPRARKVAIANPRHAPYGRAAEAAMKNLGVYEKVKDKLVLGEDIAQTAQFVESGAADVGIVALSLAVAPAMKDKGRYWEIPPEAYPRIDQGGVILWRCRNMEAAAAFRGFVLSAEGKARLKTYGFHLPGE